jgi:hypothetical protein
MNLITLGEDKGVTDVIFMLSTSSVQQYAKTFNVIGADHYQNVGGVTMYKLEL